MSVGADGEEIAKNYLLKKGYKILTQNYHSRFGEIDIIAKVHNCFVFVEVKTRSNSAFGTPLEAINRFKLRKLIKTSQFYLNQFKLGDVCYRFDAIEVNYVNGEIVIDHVENITL